MSLQNCLVVDTENTVPSTKEFSVFGINPEARVAVQSTKNKRRGSLAPLFTLSSIHPRSVP